MLIPALSAIDSCLTRAYDAHIQGRADAIATLDACRINDLHQLVLDCGATFTNELDRLMRQSLFAVWKVADSERLKATARIDKYCANMPRPSPPSSTPVGPPAAQPLNPASAGIPTPPQTRAVPDVPSDMPKDVPLEAAKDTMREPSPVASGREAGR